MGKEKLPLGSLSLDATSWQVGPYLWCFQNQESANSLSAELISILQIIQFKDEEFRMRLQRIKLRMLGEFFNTSTSHVGGGTSRTWVSLERKLLFFFRWKPVQKILVIAKNSNFAKEK